MEMPAGVCDRVLNWMRRGVDLNLVANEYGLDQLAHSQPDRGIVVINKTGCDVGVLADSGIIDVRRVAIAYSCIANWDVADAAIDPMRDEVIAVFRQIGLHLRRHLERLAAVTE